jgi:hypothetical protein
VNLVDTLMDQAFNCIRDPRSAEYRAGVRAVLERRVNGKRINLVYMPGSAECDAFHAGCTEGHRRWREHVATLNAAAANG